MSAKETRDFFWDQIFILEWYDGLVRGIGTSPGGCHLLVLVACDFERRSKAYVLLNLDRTIADEMKRLTESDSRTPRHAEWTEFNEIFDRYVTSYHRPAYLLLEEPREGKASRGFPIPKEHLKHLEEYDVEKTLSPSLQAFWMSLKQD